MALGQVHHMDIVADAGTVMGIVVVTVDTQEFTAAHSHLGDIGHQIIGNTPGIFADVAAFVGTDGVEVAQQHNAPLLIRKSHTGEDLLGHVLGPAIGIGAAAGAGILVQRHLIVSGVNRSGGGEDQILHAHGLHNLGQHQGGVQVVIVVLPGDGHGLTHCLQTSKVDDTADLVFREDLPQQSLVTDIALIELQALAGKLFHPVQAFSVGVTQIVNDYHTVAAVQQLYAGMGADIAGAAGNQYIHS